MGIMGNCLAKADYSAIMDVVLFKYMPTNVPGT
jgi:hypothetical protein